MIKLITRSSGTHKQLLPGADADKEDSSAGGFSACRLGQSALQQRAPVSYNYNLRQLNMASNYL